MVRNTFPNLLGHVPDKMIDFFLRYLIPSLLYVTTQHLQTAYLLRKTSSHEEKWNLNPKNELAKEEFLPRLVAERSH
jgi:hypothetical protein